MSAQPVPVAGEFQVNTYVTESQSNPAVLIKANGDLAVAWDSRDQDGNFEGIYGQRYNRNAVPIGDESQPNAFTTSTQSHPKLVVGPQGVVLTWRDGDFDGDAGTIMVRLEGGPEFQVNTRTTGNHMNSDIAIDDTGNFVVVWENGDDQDGDARGVFGQRFASNGSFVAGEFTINTTTASSQDNPAVATTADGRFVVAWNADVGNDQAVFAQRFNSNGTPAGAEIPVNTPSYDRNQPDVAMAPDGSLVVVWKSEVATTYEIFSRRYDSAGNPTTGVLPVADTPGYGGYSPAVAADRLGNYLVVWGNGSVDLKGRTLGPDGIAVGDDLTIAQGFNPDLAFGPDLQGLVAWEESGTDGDLSGVFARRIQGLGIFADGFETGDTAAWSLTTP